MNGSVSTPMNWFMASNVACCEPVAGSPEACVSWFGDSSANAKRNAAGAIEEIGQRIADILLTLIETARHGEIDRQIEEDIVGVIAQAGCGGTRNIQRVERTERSADAAIRGQDGVSLLDIVAGQEHRARSAAQRGRAGHLG